MALSRVSVAMTSYNGARYLGAQLDSLAAQTVKPAELVVCDDGSSDGTLAMLDTFAASAPFPVHVVRNARRLGYRANFIQTAERCTAPLIAFCDQDDVWHAEKIARVQRVFDEDAEILLVYHNAMLIRADGAAMHAFYDAPPSAAVAPALSLPPWHFSYGYSQVFRRELLAASAFWPEMRDIYHAGEAMGHDLFYFMLAATLGSVGYVHECLVEYRQHDGQTIGTDGRAAPGWMRRWRYRLEDRRETYRYLAARAADHAGLFRALQAGGDLPDALARQAACGALAWDLLSRIYAQREEAASAASLPRRARAFWRLQRQGAYGGGFWTFGRKAGAKDLVLGVGLAKLVARYGMAASKGDPTCRRGAAAALP